MEQKPPGAPFGWELRQANVGTALNHVCVHAGSI